MTVAPCATELKLNRVGIDIGKLVQYVIGLSAAPSVDRLVVITYNHQFCPITGSRSNQPHLRLTNILELVNHNMLTQVGYQLGSLRVPAYGHQRVIYQVTEKPH